MLVKSSLRPPRYALHSRSFTIQHPSPLPSPSPLPPGQEEGRKGGIGRRGRAAKEGGAGGSSGGLLIHTYCKQLTHHHNNYRSSPRRSPSSPRVVPRRESCTFPSTELTSLDRISIFPAETGMANKVFFSSKQVHPPLRKRHHDRWQEEDEPQPRNLSVCFLLFWFFSSFQHPSPLPHGDRGRDLL